MARPRSQSPKTVQVNVRLTAEQADKLAAIEFLDRVSGPEFLRRLLDGELRRREGDQRFVEALRLLTAPEPETDGQVIPFPDGGVR